MTKRKPARKARTKPAQAPAIEPVTTTAPAPATREDIDAAHRAMAEKPYRR